MRKALVGLTLGMVLILLTSVALADGEWMTLAELRQETAGRWQESVTNVRGETVVIDVAVLVPETEGMPVVTCAYDVPEGADAAWVEVIDDARGNVILRQEASDGLIYYEKRLLLPDGQAENSDLTAEEAFQTALALIRQVSPGAAFVNGGVLAYGRAYQTRTDLPDQLYDNLSCAGEMLNLDKPLDAKGLYRIWLMPLLEGIPVHDANIPKSYASIQDASNFFIDYRAYRSTGRLMDDIPLCPWAVVQEAIRGEVEAGRLRDVYSVRLCYMEMFESMEQHQNWSRNGDFNRIAAPMWVIHGETYASARSELNAADAARRAWPDYMAEQRVLQQSSQFLLIHPQTGQVLGYEDQNGQLNPKMILAPDYAAAPNQ